MAETMRKTEFMTNIAIDEDVITEDTEIIDDDVLPDDEDEKPNEDDLTRVMSRYSGTEILLKEIHREQILPADEQRKLIKEFQKGGANAKSARDKMVMSNLALVSSIAQRYQNKGVDFEDLIQEGSLGLVTAIEKYDTTKEVAFSTYATFWIKQRITRCILNHKQNIRLPICVSQWLSAIDRSRNELRNRLKREPTYEEIADDTGIPLRTVKRCVDSSYSSNTQSLDMNIGEEKDTFLIDVIPDKEAVDPDEYVLETGTREILEEVFSSMKPRLVEILKLRYGLNGDDPMTLDQIGQQIGLTRERIRQLEEKGLRQLRIKLSCPQYRGLLK